MKYVCELCGTVYDEAQGDIKRGIPAGTPFAQLPSYYDCPVCGSQKEAFTEAAKTGRTGSSKLDDSAAWKHMKYSEDHYGSER